MAVDGDVAVLVLDVDGEAEAAGRTRRSTTPSTAAYSGVPIGAARSIPACSVPQRIPKPLVSRAPAPAEPSWAGRPRRLRGRPRPAPGGGRLSAPRALRLATSCPEPGGGRRPTVTAGRPAVDAELVGDADGVAGRRGGDGLRVARAPRCRKWSRATSAAARYSAGRRRRRGHAPAGRTSSATQWRPTPTTALGVGGLLRARHRRRQRGLRRVSATTSAATCGNGRTGHRLVDDVPPVRE